MNNRRRKHDDTKKHGFNFILDYELYRFKTVHFAKNLSSVFHYKDVEVLESFQVTRIYTLVKVSLSWRVAKL